MSDNLGIFATTEAALLVHPNLFEARAFKKNGKDVGEKKYDAAFLLKPDSVDLKAIKSKAAAVARAKWPGVDLATLAWPWSSGEKKADAAKAKGKNGEYNRGHVVLTARSKFQPRLGGLEDGRIVDYETDAAKALAKPKFYFGTEALFEINLVAYENPEKNGVNAYLNQVVTLNRGERLAGGPSASETFKGYVGSTTDEDPTAGDDIPDDF